MKFSILAAVYFAAHLVGHSWASPAALEMLGDSDELEGDSKLCYLDMELNQKICNPGQYVQGADIVFGHSSVSETLT